MASNLTCAGLLGTASSLDESSEERHRRFIVALILGVYWALIFEGVFRKWLFPQWGRLLFFVRDPLVILIYALVLTRRTKLRPSIFLEVGCAFGIAGVILAVLQVTLGGAPLNGDLMIYGWRNYFFYLPLAFIIATYCDMQDLKRLARNTIMVAIPMGGLVFAQAFAPATSPINSGLGNTPEELYVVATTTGTYIRPSGTFTSSVGLVAFTTSALAMAIAMWLIPRSERQMRSSWLMCGTVAIAICLGLSGSRGAMFSAGIIVCGAVAALCLAAPEMGLKALILAVLFVVGGATLAKVFFPGPTEAFLLRWANADQTESQAYGYGGVFARAATDIVRFRLLLPDRPMIGYGLGSAGNAAWASGARDENIPFYSQEQIDAAEVDWGRNVLELGPIVGLCFIIFRLSFVVWLGKEAFITIRRLGNPLAWLLWTFVAALLSYGQITAHGTLNGYGWLFAGFCMAALYRSGDAGRPAGLGTEIGSHYDRRAMYMRSDPEFSC